MTSMPVYVNVKVTSNTKLLKFVKFGIRSFHVGCTVKLIGAPLAMYVAPPTINIVIGRKTPRMRNIELIQLEVFNPRKSTKVTPHQTRIMIKKMKSLLSAKTGLKMYANTPAIKANIVTKAMVI